MITRILRHPDPDIYLSASLPGPSSGGLRPNEITRDDLKAVAEQGFEYLGDTYVPNNESHYLFVKHINSGATLVLVQNSDPHLRSEIRFRTLPEDSSGVAHKLEHGVISESGLIPVADVFDEMRRSLLLSDVNAKTGPDVTIFLVSGLDKFSVDTMTSVFVDAVLGGRPSKDTYLREHGRLRPDPNEPCGYRFGGVVQDEMLGYYADIQTWIARAIEKNIGVAEPYAHDAGGDPMDMVDLTLSQYQQAHDRWYQASKAFIGLYGATTLREKLEFANQALDQYECGEAAEELPQAVPATSPRTLEDRVPADPESNIPIEHQHRLVRTWKGPRTLDHQERFEWQVVSLLLSSMEYSPFTQAYRASWIPNTHSRTTLKSFGNEDALVMEFCNSSESDVDRTRKTSEDLLAHFRDQGFPPQAVQAILSLMENSEIKINRSVRVGRQFVNSIRLEEGLAFAMRGQNSVNDKTVAERAQTLRNKLAQGEPVLQQIIDKYLLNNPDQMDLHLIPDEGLLERWEGALKEKISKRVDALRPEELAEVDREDRRMQERENSLEDGQDLSRAPKAELSNRYRQQHAIPHREETIGDTKLIVHEHDLEGQAKIELMFDVSDLSPYELSLTQYLGLVMSSLGPEGAELGQYQTDQMKVGFLGMGTETIRTYPDGPDSESSPRAFFQISATADIERVDEILGLVQAPLVSPQLDNLDYMSNLTRDIEGSCAASLNQPQQMIQLLIGRLDDALDPTGSYRRAEQPEFALGVLAEISRKLKEDPDGLIDDLHALHARIIKRGNLTVHATAAPEHAERLGPSLEHLAAQLPEGGSEVNREKFKPRLDAVGYRTDTNNYVGMRVQLRDQAGAPLALSGTPIVASLLINRFLNRTVRKQGGAYGASTVVTTQSGQISFISWQDPEGARTLEAYKASVDFLRTSVDQDLLDRAKVEAIKDYEAPRSPEDWSNLGFRRILSGYSKEIEEKIRAEIFDTTLAEVIEFADRLEAGIKAECAIRVYGKRENLEAIRESGVPLHIRERLS